MYVEQLHNKTLFSTVKKKKKVGALSKGERSAMENPIWQPFVLTLY